MKALPGMILSWAVLLLMTWWDVGVTWGVLLYSVLTIGALWATMEATPVRGWHLVGILTALYGGIGVVNVYLESVFFQITLPSESSLFVVLGLFEVFLISLILVRTTGRMTGPTGALTDTRMVPWWGLRVPVAALSYVVLFIIAGALIYPSVQGFYEDMVSRGEITLPSLPVVASVEFLRGLVYVAVMVPFIRVMAGRRWRAALHLGLCLAVFGGAGLLLPLELLPPEVRSVHMIEIGTSNFLFGVISALLLVRKQRGQTAAALSR